MQKKHFFPFYSQIIWWSLNRKPLYKSGNLFGLYFDISIIDLVTLAVHWSIQTSKSNVTYTNEYSVSMRSTALFEMPASSRTFSRSSIIWFMKYIYFFMYSIYTLSGRFCQLCVIFTIFFLNIFTHPNLLKERGAIRLRQYLESGGFESTQVHGKLENSIYIL